MLFFWCLQRTAPCGLGDCHVDGFLGRFGQHGARSFLQKASICNKYPLETDFPRRSSSLFTFLSTLSLLKAPPHFMSGPAMKNAQFIDLGTNLANFMSNKPGSCATRYRRELGCPLYRYIQAQWRK